MVWVENGADALLKLAAEREWIEIRVQTMRRRAERGCTPLALRKHKLLLKQGKIPEWGWESKGPYLVALSICFLKDGGVESRRADRKSEGTDLTWNCLCSDGARVEDSRGALGPL